MPKVLSFEEALARLQQITTTLEKGDVNLDDSIKLFEEGSKLSLICYKKLENARQKVIQISENKE